MRKIVEVPFMVLDVSASKLTTSEGDYYAVKIASKEFGVAKSTLTEWAREGKITCIPLEVVYISAKDIMEMKKTHVAYTRVRKEII